MWVIHIQPWSFSFKAKSHVMAKKTNTISFFEINVEKIAKKQKNQPFG